MKINLWSIGRNDYWLDLGFSYDGAFNWIPCLQESGTEAPSQHSDHMSLKYKVFGFLWWHLFWCKGHYSWNKYYALRNPKGKI